MTEDFSPARIADRLEIQDVVVRFARAVDRLELGSIEDLFHPGATDDHSGVYRGDIPGLIKWIGERHRNIEFSAHLVTNIRIEFAGPDLALVESYVLAAQRYKEGAGTAVPVEGENPAIDSKHRTDSLAFARYIDRFERREGDWKIAERVCPFDSIHLFDVPAGAFLMNPGWTVGTRDRNDPLFVAREALGLDS